MSSQLEQAIANVVNTNDNFSMTHLLAVAWPQIEALPRVAPVIQTIKNRLGIRNSRKLSQAILRNSFLIELVNVPAIETTKFRVRWYSQLNNDPRFCSFDECVEIASDLLETLPNWLNDVNHSEALNMFFTNGIIPYDAPIDYTERFTRSGRIHARGNITWYYDELTLPTLRLRKYLTDSSQSPDVDFFRRVLKDKIRVKTYLTDRVLTGDNKTNREKRWETHPRSVHFAERRTCMAIEYVLVTQICEFQGFPSAFLKKLQSENVIPYNLSTALCPITGDALSYEAFRNGLLNPTHGKSDFHVGHLNPLKLGAANTQGEGHTAENISWISADGNRIQGSLSLDDVRELIRRIAENYTNHGLWPNQIG